MGNRQAIFPSMGLNRSLLLFLSLLFAMQTTAMGIDREDVDPSHTWDLTHIYKTEAQWETDFQQLEKMIGGYKKLEGTLGKSASDLLKALKFDEDVSVRFARLRMYASLAKDLDLGNAKYQAMFDRIQMLGAKAGAASAFIRPEISAIDDNTLDGFLKQNADLAIYKQFFHNLRRMKKHTRSKEVEEVLALSSPISSAPHNAFGLLKDADLKYPTVKDPDGKDFPVSTGRYYAAMYSPDRDFRRRVYKGFYEPYMAFDNTFASLLSGNIKGDLFRAKVRKYDSALEASLTPNNIPMAVYNNLIRDVNENLAPLQRWGRLKQKILKLKDLHPYDTYVTLFPKVKKEFSYEQGTELSVKGLHLLGEEYVEDMKRAYDKRWIDVHETPGKRTGAYSSSHAIGVHPYVLLNWNNQQNDVFTLVHEMGHCMHSFYTEREQPYVYADYSIFLAEVASTTNEALLLDYMIEHAETKEEKMALIEQNLNNITNTFYRQTRFAEYELALHEKVQKGEPLTPDVLTKLHGDMYQKYWGEAMTVDEEEGHAWARIPHLYYNFYVYQYATSFAASQAFVQNFKKEGQPAVDKFRTFLESGKSKYPIDILKDAGVDMTSRQPVQAVAERMNELLDKLEKLLEEE